MSVLRAVGAIFNLFLICFTLDNQMKVHIVLFSSTVILTAVSYDVLNYHYIILVSVYMEICLHRGLQGRIAITAKCVTLLNIV